MAPNTVSGSASEEEIRKFKEILKKNGISDEVKSLFMTDPPELKGEHMATASIYAKIEFKDPSIKEKNLFLKQFFANSEGHTSMVKKMRVMEKEAAFFNEFLPALKEFGSKFGRFGDMLDFFPKCLYADDEMIILENLVLDDTFIMLPKEDRQDLFTAKFVLDNLAKFHATSYAYIKNMGLDKFREKWEVICHESFLGESNPMICAMFDNGASTCINILKGRPIEGDQEAIEALTGYLGKSHEVVKDQLQLPEGVDDLIVVNHGDFHNNNMLFKKDQETGKVHEQKFVDLQITRCGSPNLDVGYFLYTSVKPPIRRAHLKELLQHYYDSFEKHVEAFNLKMPVSFDTFYEDYKQRSQLGYFMNLMVISALGAFKDINHEEIGEDPAEFMALFQKIIQNWLNNNPKQADEIATEIVAVVREYKSLMA